MTGCPLPRSQQALDNSAGRLSVSERVHRDIRLGLISPRRMLDLYDMVKELRRNYVTVAHRSSAVSVMWLGLTPSRNEGGELAWRTSVTA